MERFVAVEPRRGSQEAAEGRWEVFWDRGDSKLGGLTVVQGRLVLRVSLERLMIDDGEEEDPSSTGASVGMPSSAIDTTRSDQAHSAQRHVNERDE